MNNKTEVTAIPEDLANKTSLCEIRFDCSVTMHDVGFRKYKDPIGFEKQSRIPQWFRANSSLTLEAIKHGDPESIGLQIKQMYQQLETMIKQYEQSR